MGPGKRCNNGYHTRGTVPEEDSNGRHNGENMGRKNMSYRDKLMEKNNSSNQSNKLSSDQKSFLMDFLMRIAGSL